MKTEQEYLDIINKQQKLIDDLMNKVTAQSELITAYRNLMTLNEVNASLKPASDLKSSI